MFNVATFGIACGLVSGAAAVVTGWHIRVAIDRLLVAMDSEYPNSPQLEAIQAMHAARVSLLVVVLSGVVSAGLLTFAAFWTVSS